MSESPPNVSNWVIKKRIISNSQSNLKAFENRLKTVNTQLSECVYKLEHLNVQIVWILIFYEAELFDSYYFVIF